MWLFNDYNNKPKYHFLHGKYNFEPRLSIMTANLFHIMQRVLNYIKISLLIVTTCCLSACKLNQAVIRHETLDLNRIKYLPLHPKVIDSENQHFYLWKNKVIRYLENTDNIMIQESFEESPYKSVKVYFRKNLLLNRKETWFYDFCIGIRKIYNDKGVLTETIDCDKKYKFTVIQLVEKLKKKYSLDFTSRKGNIKVISRNYLFNRDCYDIRIYLTPNAKGPVRNLILDGVTGQVISDQVETYKSTNEPRI